MNTEEQEKAAQWIAENVPCLPQNVGELTAMLSEYHQSELPTEEEITEKLENLWDELHWSCGEGIDDLQQVAGNRLLLDSEFQRELLPKFRKAITNLLSGERPKEGGEG